MWCALLAASCVSALAIGPALFEGIGGRDLSGWGRLGLAWLSLAGAGLGAYCLARKLGLERASAGLAAVGYGLSGGLVCRVDSTAGHVAPILPWIVYAIESVGAPRGLRWRALIALIALGALSMLGGDLETASLGLAASVIWILGGFGRDPRAAARAILALALGIGIAAVAGPPGAELMRISSTPAGPRSLTAEHRFDFLSLALVVITTGIVLRWRALAAQDENDRFRREPAPQRGERAPGWAGVAGVVLCLFSSAAILAQRGLPEHARVALVGDALGTPSSGGYRGQESFVEAGGAHLALVVLALGIAALLSTRGSIARRRSVEVLAVSSFFLALEVPGVVDTWRALPGLGLVDPSRAAAVSALFVALLAGEALEAGSRAARRTAALVVMGLLVLCFVHRAGPVVTPAMGAPDPPEGLVNWIERPGATIDGGRVGFAGWIHPAVAFDHLRARADALDPQGGVIVGKSREFTVVEERWPGARVGEAPADSRFFRAPDVGLQGMKDGVWRFSLDFYQRDASGRELRSATRTVAISALSRVPQVSIASAVLALATLAALLFVPASTRGAAWWVVALALVQGLLFAREAMTWSTS